MFPTLSNCFPFEFIALLPTIESDDLSEFSILRFPIHSAVEPSEQIIRLDTSWQFPLADAMGGEINPQNMTIEITTSRRLLITFTHH